MTSMKEKLQWYARHKPNEWTSIQTTGPHDTDELIELLLNDDIPMETATVRESKYVDWMAVEDIDDFPEKILTELKKKHQEHTSLRTLFLKHDDDGSATLDRQELGNVLAELQFPCELKEEEFKKIDSDKSGHIDFEEFHAYLDRVAPQVIAHKLWYYIDDEGNEEGPVPQINLEYWGNRGQVKDDLKVRREDYDDYHSIGPSNLFPENWLERAEDGIDSEMSTDEEEQPLDPLYVYHAYSCVPQDDWLFVRNIKQLEGKLDTNRSVIDSLRLNFLKHIDNILELWRSKDANALAKMIFPRFVFKNAMNIVHLACPQKNIGRAILENKFCNTQFKSLSRVLESVRKGSGEEVIHWAVSDDEDNIVAVHPEYYTLLARFPNVKPPLQDWMYCLLPGKDIAEEKKHTFDVDQFLPVNEWFPVPSKEVHYGMMSDVLRCPYRDFTENLGQGIEMYQ